MRRLVLTTVLAVVCGVAWLSLPSKAEARPRWGGWYSGYYAPSYYGWYGSSAYYTPSYYSSYYAVPAYDYASTYSTPTYSSSYYTPSYDYDTYSTPSYSYSSYYPSYSYSSYYYPSYGYR